MTLQQWLRQVVRLLNNRKVTHRRWTAELLIDIRGDEPYDVKALGDSPAKYVKFLQDEYSIFGPDGE